jgi:hypothetical protein
MNNQKKDSLSAETTDPGARPGDHDQTAAGTHEPPRITRLGTVAELTLGHPIANETDGTFPGSIFV